jgi:hypothetical protein
MVAVRFVKVIKESMKEKTMVMRMNDENMPLNPTDALEREVRSMRTPIEVPNMIVKVAVAKDVVAAAMLEE